MEENEATWGDVAEAAAEGFRDIVNTYLSVQQYNQQRADQRYYYEDQKKWNSPANQVYLRSLAGLNPYSEYTAAGVSTPNGVQPNNDGLRMGQDSLSQRRQYKINLMAQRLAEKQLILESKKTDNQIKLTDEQARLIASQFNSQEYLNWLNSITSPYAVSQRMSEADSALFNSIVAKTQSDYLPSKLQQEIDYLFEQTLGQSLSNDYYPKEYYLRSRDVGVREAAQQLNEDYYNNIDLPLAQFDIKQADFDKAGIDFIDQVLKDVDADKKMSAGTKAFVKAIIRIGSMVAQSRLNRYSSKKR